MSSTISIKNLVFSRDKKLIFNDINLEIARGTITGIMGPSGTGKTTLLKLIGAQLQPDQGSIEINGQNIHQLSRKKLFKLRRHIGMLFQSAALFTDLNVFENVAFPLRVHTQLSEIMIRDMVLIKLEAVGLRDAQNLMSSELSGGMARRVALARAAILDPDLILYDEPFTGLDPVAKGVIVKLIQDFNAALGITTVLVSHDVPEVLKIADYVYVLSSGKFIGQGTPQQIMNNPHPELHQFMLGLPDGVVPFHYSTSDYYKELFGSMTQHSHISKEVTV